MSGISMKRLDMIRRHLEPCKQATELVKIKWIMTMEKDLDMPVHPSGLKGKVAIITGGNRGIGFQMAEQLAKEGCNIVVAAKTVEPKPKTMETIYEAAELLEKLGVKALAVKCDVRSEDSVKNVVDKAMEKFGRIDIMINNAGALVPWETDRLKMKEYDLMQAITVRGGFMFTKYCIPHLLESENAHVLFTVPPVNLKEPSFFASSLGYTMSKFSAGLMMLGLAAEYEGRIGSNSIWPRTVINTNAITHVTNGLMTEFCREPLVVARAVVHILKSDCRKVSG